jgi:hypothetical protein
MDRADLHALVDTLPEGAIENAKRILEHLQVWPPQPAPETERMRQIRQEQMERMRRSMRPGTVGGGGGGGSFNPTTGYGLYGHTRWEDDTAVHDSYHFFKGQEIVLTERMRFTDDGKAIRYTFEAKGPKGDSILNEMTFDIG